VGWLTATAAVATKVDRKAFKSGREFAARFGSVPEQTGTGGQIQLLRIYRQRLAWARLK